MSTPVAILGGFLGSGKTTAVNHLLGRAQCRIAVLVNDFGAINIDAQLIEARDGDLVALSNGCVCCAVGSDLSESFARVLRRLPSPERIVVEASGVSDPWRIAQLVRLEPNVELEVVAVLVDAVAFPGQLEDPWLTDTLERQLVRADLIVLSKCDLASEAMRAAARAAVRRIRPEAPVVEITGGALPEAIAGSTSTTTPTRFRAEMAGHGFRSWHWDAAEALDETRLRTVLSSLPNSVLRAKGICRLGPGREPHLLQLVGRRWTLQPWPKPEAETAIVLIGTDRLPTADELNDLFGGTVIISPAKNAGP